MPHWNNVTDVAAVVGSPAALAASRNVMHRLLRSDARKAEKGIAQAAVLKK